MPAERRVGSTTSETRASILAATEQLMVDKGYASVTSRRVAAAVGINPGLVHYYFPTLDDLFIAVFRRGAEKNLVRMAGALASPTPLLSLWRWSSDPRGVALLGVREQALGISTEHREAAAAVEALLEELEERRARGARRPPPRRRRRS